MDPVIAKVVATGLITEGKKLLDRKKEAKRKLPSEYVRVISCTKTVEDHIYPIEMQIEEALNDVIAQEADRGKLKNITRVFMNYRADIGDTIVTAILIFDYLDKPGEEEVVYPRDMED